MDATTLPGAETAIESETAPPVAARDRLRFALLLGLVLLWVLPSWGLAQVGDAFVRQIGALRTGAAAGIGLLVLVGLAATSFLARTGRGLRAGLAATHAIAATATTVLLATEHPWIPGGARRLDWVPVFAPLAVLAALDAWRGAVDPRHGTLLGWARAFAGLFAAGAFYVADAPIPAGIAAWLGLGGFAAVRVTGAVGVRRTIEALTMVAALIVGAAPQIQSRFVGVELLESGSHGWPEVVWVVLAAILATTGVDGVLRPVPDADAP